MNIGMILDKQFPPDPRVENEAISLTEAGHDVFLLSFNFQNLPEYEIINGIHVIRISISKNMSNKLRTLIHVVPLYNLFIAKHIKKLSNKYGINILHIHDLHLARPGLMANKKLKLKLILDLHENYVEALKSYSFTKSLAGRLIFNEKRWWKFESEVLHRVDKIIVLSEYFKSCFLDKYQDLENDQFVVVPNGVILESFLSIPLDKKVLPADGSFYLIYFGDIAKRRGIDISIEAMKIIGKHHPEIKLVLLGRIDKYEYHMFQKMINDSSVRERLIYKGWQPFERVPSYISASHVGLCPIVKNAQHESGIANKVYQYMALGKPVIVSNSIPQQQLVEATQAGMVFESGNAEDLAGKVIKLYQDNKRRQIMGRNAEKAIVTRYNWKETVKPLISMYDSV
ncbi:glycosyltransferase family 4 protein [bacterium]|nr:glycosyltransferase family 4 protein [bacterium]